MDITNEFKNIVISNNTTINGAVYNKSQSTYIIKSTELLLHLNSFEKLLENYYEDFIDYHCLFSLNIKPKLNDTDRSKFSNEVNLFLKTFSKELNDLRKYINIIAKNHTKSTIIHYNDIISYLLEKFNCFTKKSQHMHREREKRHRDPFKLISSYFDINNFDDLSNSNFNHIDRDKLEIKEDVLSPSSSSSNIKEPSNTDKILNLTSDFAERYESEIAPPQLLKKYNEIAVNQKKSLLNEAKILKIQYSEEKKNSINMESNAGEISNMLTDFVQILQSQRDGVEDLYESSKKATEHVHDVDNELILTIERSTSHQRYMTLLTVGLGLFLLLLDYLTP